MIFAERATDTGFTYDLEDVFGKVHIEATEKLTPELLDGMVMTLLKGSPTAERIEGELEYESGKVAYQFIRASLWEEDDEEEPPCNDSPTSTPEQESENTRTVRSTAGILSWLRRFAGAFREAWRKADGYQQEGKGAVRGE